MKFLSYLIFSAFPSLLAYNYELKTFDHHKVHIVTLNPQEYDIRFIKANPTSIFGRKSVEELAQQYNASCAINAGFFEMGKQDGMPSGTYISDYRLYNFKFSLHDCLLQKADGQLFIENIEPTITASAGEQTIAITTVNKYVEKDEIILYTSVWGEKTGTSSVERYEVAFDAHYNLQGVYRHGNISIPENGFVISFPATTTVDLEHLCLHPIGFRENGIQAAVMGIPMLVYKGRIPEKVINNTMPGHIRPYARTALGLRPDGTIVMVVAEQHVMKDIHSITLEDIKELLYSQASKIAAKYRKPYSQLTLAEVKEIVETSFLNDNCIVSFTMTDLAQFMIDLGCTSAINLCGGNSSCLCIEGKTVTPAQKPVSDAILFIKK